MNHSHAAIASSNDNNVTLMQQQHRRFYGPNATEYFFQQDENDSLAGKIMAFLFLATVLFCACAQSSVHDDDERHRRVVRQRRQRAKEQRKKHMNACLVTKRVIACDHDLNLTLGEVPKIKDEENGLMSPDNEVEQEVDEENEDAAACVICLEVFRVGDDVTWSKNNEECLHVFHKDCIVPWLQNPKHNDCPSCRCQIVIIPEEEEEVEEEEEDTSSDIDNDDNDDEEENVAMVFSIMNGLISRVRRASQRYSLLGDSLNDDLDQFDDVDPEIGLVVVPPPTLEPRRAVSDRPPSHGRQQRRRRRRISFPPRRSSLLSTAYQRASELMFSSSSTIVVDEESSIGLQADNHEEPNSSRIPLPPLRIRRVQSCADPNGSSSSVLGSDYVIDRQEETDGNNPEAPPVAPLRRSISLKRVRSVDASNQAEHLCRHTSDSFLHQKEHPRRRASRRRSCEEESNVLPPSTLPIRRSVSEQSGALRRTFFDG